MPWGIEKEDGKHQGLLVELAREFSDVLQEPISNRLRPYPRVLVDIEHGSSDLAVLFTSPHSKNIGHPLGLVIEAAVIAVSKKITLLLPLWMSWVMSELPTFVVLSTAPPLIITQR